MCLLYDFSQATQSLGLDVSLSESRDNLLKRIKKSIDPSFWEKKISNKYASCDEL